MPEKKRHQPRKSPAVVGKAPARTGTRKRVDQGLDLEEFLEFMHELQLDAGEPSSG